MDNITHNSSSSSSWDLDMSLGSHHHPLLFDSHHQASAPPPPPPLPFHLSSASSSHHHHHALHPPTHHHRHHPSLDPSPSSSLFPPPHHRLHHHLGLDIDPASSSHHRRHEYGEQPPEQHHHHHEQQKEQEEAGTGGDERGGGGAAEDVEEELGAMKEMMYRIAAMQPVDIDPATIKKPRRRNVRISDDPQSVAARHRRERISERIRILQRLVPGGTKMDTASMLDEAIRYIKFLKRQVQDLQHQPPQPQQQFPGGAGPSTSLVGPSPAGRPGVGAPFLPLGPGPLIDWAGLVRPVDVHGPTSSSSSSSMGGAHAALGFGFSSAGGQSSHGMH